MEELGNREEVIPVGGVTTPSWSPEAKLVRGAHTPMVNPLSTWPIRHPLLLKSLKVQTSLSPPSTVAADSSPNMRLQLLKDRPDILGLGFHIYH